MEFDGLDEMMPYDGKVFISECEGAISLNSPALDACVKFIPDGYRFYKVLSSYDEALSDVIRKEGHRSGDRVKLLLPFLKAFGATDEGLIDNSKDKLQMVPGSEKTMRFVQEIMSPFIVSPSYEHHLAATCERIGFPLDNTFSTKFSLDSIKIDDWEVQTLRDLVNEIAEMQPIVHGLGNRLKDLKLEDRRTIQRLDQIFGNEMTDLSSYHLIVDTVMIGDSEKASAVVEICKRLGIALEDCIYIGGSATDAKALSIIRKGGGLAVSFNGSSRAVKEADLAVMSGNTIITSMLADAFYKTGKEAVLDMVDTWGYESMTRSGLVHEYILREVRKVFGEALPIVQRVTDDKVTELALMSSKYRRFAIDEEIGNTG